MMWILRVNLLDLLRYLVPSALRVWIDMARINEDHGFSFGCCGENDGRMVGGILYEQPMRIL